MKHQEENVGDRKTVKGYIMRRIYITSKQTVCDLTIG